MWLDGRETKLADVGERQEWLMKREKEALIGGGNYREALRLGCGGVSVGAELPEGRRRGWW